MGVTTVQPENPFIEFVQRFAKDPVGFCLIVLGVVLDDWQADAMRRVAAGERRISIRSGHGVGKSAFVALLCVWAMIVNSNVKIVITAPSGPQLYDGLYSEVKLWMSQLPAGICNLFDIKTDRIELLAAPESVFLSVRTSRAENPEALQGVHADAGLVLLICDEASGIPEAVFEAASGSMSGHNCTTVLLGNPTRGSGLFFDTHHRLKSNWWTRRVSCLDSARVSHDYVQDMKDRYGEDSNAYRVRVLGEFPRAEDDTLISFELASASLTRDIVLTPTENRFWGVDLARFGSDASALCKRFGSVVPERVKVWKNADLMQSVAIVRNEYDTTPSDQRPVEIFADVIGLGAGFVDRARELGLPVRGINVSETPSYGSNCLNLRAELWNEGKKWLESRNCRIEGDEDLISELTTPRYRFNSSGKLQIESKEDMKKRGLASPNRADAFLLTFAGSAATTAGVPGYTSKWNKPLKRKIKGIV
jgi:phage terminase large subunit